MDQHTEEFTIPTVHEATRRFSHTVNIADTVHANQHTKQTIAPVHGLKNHFAHTVKLADGGSENVNGELLKSGRLQN